MISSAVIEQRSAVSLNVNCFVWPFSLEAGYAPRTGNESLLSSPSSYLRTDVVSVVQLISLCCDLRIKGPVELHDAFFEGRVSDAHPSFNEGSGVGNDSAPVDVDAAGIVYSDADDEAIDEFSRKFVID
jgi:hypothetical protein